MARRIGIDFDNTLVCYDRLFKQLAVEYGCAELDLPADKQGLRDLLRQQADGEILWQRLQAQAYGPRIAEAELFPGVEATLASCRARGDQLFVVSHKSRFAAQKNGGVDLQDAARAFLHRCGLFEKQLLNPSQVYFSGSRAEKVARIAELNCDLFIDDLPETFAEAGFPPATRPILFSTGPAPAGAESCHSWAQLAALLELP